MLPVTKDFVQGAFFATATSQSPGVPETLATAYNPGMCLWALPFCACGIMIALHAIQTDVVGLPRFAGIIPGKPRLEK